MSSSVLEKGRDYTVEPDHLLQSKLASTEISAPDYTTGVIYSGGDGDVTDHRCIVCSDWCSEHSQCSNRYNQIESFDECTFNAPEFSYICDDCMNVQEYRGSHVVTFTDTNVIAQLKFTDAERVNS